MATFNLTPSQTAVPSSGQGLINGRTPAIVEACVDFGTVTLPTGVTGISGTSGTVIDLINVPAGFIVLATTLEVLKADSAGNSGTLTVKVGAASQGSAETVAATGFIASAGTVTPVVAAGSGALITLTVGTGTINAVVRVSAVLLDIRAKPGTPIFIGTWTNPAGQTAVWGQDPVSNYSTALTYVT